MKKCVILFTLLILALLLAVFTDEKEHVDLLDEVVITENSLDKLLVE